MAGRKSFVLHPLSEPELRTLSRHWGLGCTMHIQLVHDSSLLDTPPDVWATML